MIQRILRTALVAGAAVLLPSCIEADVETELKADGTGTFGVSMKFSEKFVAIARKLEKLDPEQEALAEMKDLLFEKPDAETLARLEKAGLKVIDMETINDEKNISAKVKVGFQSLAALREFDSVVEKEGKKGKGSSPADDMRLVRNEDGTYSLTLGMADGPGGGGDDEDADEEGDEDGDDDGEDDGDEGGDDDGEDDGDDEAGEKPARKEQTPEEAAKQMKEIMPLLGELMGEAQNLRISIAMRVPGEVVEFTPASFGKKEEGRVVWTLDFQSMMAAAMGGESNPMENFTVRFRMPAGTSIPDAALWAGKPAKDPAKTATPPAKEEGTPGGEPK